MFAQRHPAFGLTIAVCAALVLTTAARANEVTGTVALEPAEDGPVFGYDGDIGPETWSQLSSDWATCGSGHRQSPIDLKVDETIRRNVPDVE